MKLYRNLFLITALSFASLPALASTPEQPKSVKELRAYKFVISEKDDEFKMQIEDEEYGLIGGGKGGFIKYRLATWKGKTIVQINMIEGVKGTRGVGKMLKREVLRRHDGRQIESELVSVNRTKLLKAWAKGYPHNASDTNGELFRKAVPAMQFEGFNYVIRPKVPSSGVGGRIELSMSAARRGRDGKIVIEDPIALDKILATTEPELIRAKDRPKTAQEEKAEARENENAAKKAGKLLEKLADKVARKEKVDEDDLLEHLWEIMDDECGKGGRDGKGWAEGCLFTRKGSSYVVKSENSRSSFYLDKRMDDEADNFVDDNT